MEFGMILSSGEDYSPSWALQLCTVGARRWASDAGSLRAFWCLSWLAPGHSCPSTAMNTLCPSPPSCGFPEKSNIEKPLFPRVCARCFILVTLGTSLNQPVIQELTRLITYGCEKRGPESFRDPALVNRSPLSCPSCLCSGLSSALDCAFTLSSHPSPVLDAPLFSWGRATGVPWKSGGEDSGSPPDQSWDPGSSLSFLPPSSSSWACHLNEQHVATSANPESAMCFQSIANQPKERNDCQTLHLGQTQPKQRLLGPQPGPLLPPGCQLPLAP